MQTEDTKDHELNLIVFAGTFTEEDLVNITQKRKKKRIIHQCIHSVSWWLNHPLYVNSGYPFSTLTTMKKQLLLCLTLVLGLEINAFAKNSVTISVSRQGSLSEQLKKYDALTSLKVCGRS